MTYLVITLGNETNLFDMNDLAVHAFTMKSIGDAIILRNHVINMLEQADIEHEDANLRKSLLTFVTVGGGFSGVETVGELNDLVRDSIKNYYHNIEGTDARVILINSGGRILPEVTEDLSQFALQKTQESGAEVRLNTRLLGFDSSSVKLNNGEDISTQILIWAGGGKPIHLISCLECEHDKTGRIIINEYLEMQADHENIFALGDCAYTVDPHTGKPCPPTAQNAMRQERVVAANVASAIRAKKSRRIKKRKYDYKTKGMMALIGRRNGVGILFGHKIQGFSAWAIWRFYYLSSLPTVQKKLRVMVDWFVDLFFKRDVTRLKMSSLDNTLLRSLLIERRKD